MTKFSTQRKPRRGAVKAVTSKDEYSRFAMSSLDLTEKATDLSNKVGT
jgi:hypothetical protein